ncbi:MAG: hypothetical protein WC011_04030 [Candidatus Paceibacterota bacterium]
MKAQDRQLLVSVLKSYLSEVNQQEYLDKIFDVLKKLKNKNIVVSKHYKNHNFSEEDLKNILEILKDINLGYENLKDYFENWATEDIQRVTYQVEKFDQEYKFLDKYFKNLSSYTWGKIIDVLNKIDLLVVKLESYYKNSSKKEIQKIISQTQKIVSGNENLLKNNFNLTDFKYFSSIFKKEINLKNLPDLPCFAIFYNTTAIIVYKSAMKEWRNHDILLGNPDGLVPVSAFCLPYDKKTQYLNIW